MAREEEQSEYGGIAKTAGILILLLAILFFFNPVVIVGAGSRGVLLEWGNVKGVLGEGMSFRMPIAQSVVIMDVQAQKYEVEKISAASSDLQDVSTSVAVNYHLDPDSVGVLYKNVGVDYANRIIAPAVQESVKAATARYTAEQLITQRPTVKEVIDRELGQRLAKYNMIVEAVSITNFEFSAEFTQAIESKVKAEQDALKAENVLRQVKIEAEQKVASAQAEAESLRIQNEQLAKSRDVLELRWIQKWDGKLPSVMVSGSGNPGLLLGMNMPSYTTGIAQNEANQSGSQ